MVEHLPTLRVCMPYVAGEVFSRTADFSIQKRICFKGCRTLILDEKEDDEDEEDEEEEEEAKTIAVEISQDLRTQRFPGNNWNQYQI